VAIITAQKHRRETNEELSIYNSLVKLFNEIHPREEDMVSKLDPKL
jgi:hypothetical protein